MLSYVQIGLLPLALSRLSRGSVVVNGGKVNVNPIMGMTVRTEKFCMLTVTR